MVIVVVMVTAVVMVQGRPGSSKGIMAIDRVL
jgi:hypothetical protein